MAYQFIGRLKTAAVEIFMNGKDEFSLVEIRLFNAQNAYHEFRKGALERRQEPVWRGIQRKDIPGIFRSGQMTGPAEKFIALFRAEFFEQNMIQAVFEHTVDLHGNKLPEILPANGDVAEFIPPKEVMTFLAVLEHTVLRRDALGSDDRADMLVELFKHGHGVQGFCPLA